MKADVHTNFAFPFVFQSGTDANGLPTMMVNAGLTKRELFAMAAMQGLLANYEAQRNICNSDPRYKAQPDGQFNFAAVVAVNSTEFADALLEALEK